MLLTWRVNSTEETPRKMLKVEVEITEDVRLTIPGDNENMISVKFL